MKLYPICHEHDAHGSSPHARCALCDRWWATYNAALGGLIAFTHDDDGSREFTDECRAEARRIADAEHGSLPDKKPQSEQPDMESVATLVEAVQRVLQRADDDAPASFVFAAIDQLREALKPFEDKL